MKKRPTRRSSPRAVGYDYSNPGACFFTIRTLGGKSLFGDIIAGQMMTNDFGQAILECWNNLPQHFPLVELDTFIVMPNHVHGIVVLLRKEMHEKPEYDLSEVIRALKSFSTRRINESRGTPGFSIWQRSFYDHIIRDDRDLDRVRGYIEANPANWQYDSDNPGSDRSKVRQVSVTGERV